MRCPAAHPVPDLPCLRDAGHVGFHRAEEPSPSWRGGTTCWLWATPDTVRPPSDIPLGAYVEPDLEVVNGG